MNDALPKWLPDNADDWIIEMGNGDLDCSIEGAAAVMVMEASDPNHCPKCRRLVLRAAQRLSARDRAKLGKIMRRGRAPGAMELAKAGILLSAHMTLGEIAAAWYG